MAGSNRLATPTGVVAVGNGATRAGKGKRLVRLRQRVRRILGGARPRTPAADPLSGVNAPLAMPSDAPPPTPAPRSLRTPAAFRRRPAPMPSLPRPDLMTDRPCFPRMVPPRSLTPSPDVGAQRSAGSLCPLRFLWAPFRNPRARSAPSADPSEQDSPRRTRRARRPSRKDAGARSPEPRAIMRGPSRTAIRPAGPLFFVSSASSCPSCSSW